MLPGPAPRAPETSLVGQRDIDVRYYGGLLWRQRAFLAACTPAEREALLNQMKVKEPEIHRKYRAQIDKSLQEIRDRGFCVSYGDLRREIHAVGVPMRRTVDGEIVAFNCSIPAFMLKKGQIEDDIGPRLVQMVRNIEAALGMH